MSTLIVMTGLPGSGKDTWIKDFIAKEENKHFKVISTDDIIDEYAEANGLTYNEAFSGHIKDAEKEMNRRVAEYSENGYDVIWNQTNMGVKKRKKILNKFKYYDNRMSVTVLIDDAVHKERLAVRAKNELKFISLGVVDSMREMYSEPHLDEGFTSVTVLDNSGDKFELVRITTDQDKL